jgi:hypothetical protein
MVRVPQLGRAVYVILALAVLILVITYGGMELWPRLEAYQTMRSLDRQWRDARLTASARRKAADMLAEFGPDAAPFLLTAARDEDSRVRERAFAYLAGLDPIPDEAVQICMTALKEDREPTARAARWGPRRTSSADRSNGGRSSSRRSWRPAATTRRSSGVRRCGPWSTPVR